MYKSLIAFILASVCLISVIHAQPVYVCYNQDGTKYYKNKGSAEGCKLVQFPAAAKTTKKSRNLIEIGMKPEQVRSALGSPAQVYRTRTASGTSILWVYKNGNSVQFDNGKVSVIKD